MAIIPQLVTADADVDGDAVFLFPDVPQGELWSGTTTIPGAPAGAIGTVTASGMVLGAMHGPGSYGPWTCDYSQRLAISATGLAPGTQYVAVWHADSKGSEYSTYPAPITPTVTGSVAIPEPLEIFFNGPQPVTGTVSLTQAGGVAAGQVVMTGAAVALPALVATQGVVLSAPTANAHPLALGPSGVSATTGLVLGAGQMTPLLPVSNSADLFAIGTAPDVVSFLVT